jgi:hypothetical protein
MVLVQVITPTLFHIDRVINFCFNNIILLFSAQFYHKNYCLILYEGNQASRLCGVITTIREKCKMRHPATVSLADFQSRGKVAERKIAAFFMANHTTHSNERTKFEKESYFCEGVQRDFVVTPTKQKSPEQSKRSNEDGSKRAKVDKLTQKTLNKQAYGFAYIINGSGLGKTWEGYHVAETITTKLQPTRKCLRVHLDFINRNK